MKNKNEKTAVFRCDASPSIGSGHVMRCLTLADFLRGNGWKCVFSVSPETLRTIPALQNGSYQTMENTSHPEHADVTIIDHYGLDAAYESAARAWTGRILVIDDLADRPHDCDVLIDQTYGRVPQDYETLVPEGCHILTGAAYALIRPEFLAARESSAARRQAHAGPPKNILVSMGSTNIHNITGFILDALKQFDKAPLDIKVVLGSAASRLEEVKASVKAMNETGLHTVSLYMDVKNMADMMQNADLAFGAGGTTSWERCCLGLPAIMLEIADNQKTVAAQLHSAGAVENLGWYEGVSPAQIIRALEWFFENPQTLRDMSVKAAEICDGYGVRRIMPHLVAPVKNREGAPVSLRLAEAQDTRLTFEWQILPETRKHFRNPGPPAWSEHEAWFARRVNDLSSALYIIECNGTAAGMLRLDRDAARQPEAVYEISILLAPEFKGKGVAAIALNDARALYPKAVFRAEVLPENKASVGLFLKAGYEPGAGNWYINAPAESKAA